MKMGEDRCQLLLPAYHHFCFSCHCSSLFRLSPPQQLPEWLNLSFYSGKAFTAESLSRLSPVLVTNESSRTEVSISQSTEKSDADKIVDGLDFGELCNEFECISSPLVESTPRQLFGDILELREGNRAIGTYAVSVKYKELYWSYKRSLWATTALQKPSVAVQGMIFEVN